LRRHYSSWLIDFFKELIDDAHFLLGNAVHQECAWYVFKDLLQTELDQKKNWWNMHYIRKSKPGVVSGVPDTLYFLPESKGYYECGIDVSNSDIDQAVGNSNIVSTAPGIMNNINSELKEYFDCVINVKSLRYPPANWTEAKETFIAIVETANC